MLIHVSLPDRVLVVCHLQSLKFTFHFVTVECPSWRIKTYSNLYVIEGTEVSSFRLNSLSKRVGNDLRLQQTTFINIFLCFSEKIRLDVSSESSARQRIHMKHQAIFSSKDKCKKLKCRLLHICLEP